MTSSQLAGRIALVISADEPAGSAVALELARRGATVAAQYNASFEAAKRVVRGIEEVGALAVAFKADPQDRAQLAALGRKVCGALGGVDLIVVCCASGRAAAPGYATGRTTAEWAETVRADLLARLAPLRAALPGMAGPDGASLIYLANAAMLAAAGIPGPWLTCAVLGAAMTQVVTELAAAKVQVNAVLADAAAPQEAAKAVARLASADLGYLTGAVVAAGGRPA